MNLVYMLFDFEFNIVTSFKSRWKISPISTKISCPRKIQKLIMTQFESSI